MFNNLDKLSTGRCYQMSPLLCGLKMWRPLYQVKRRFEKRKDTIF
jgi:hypothetical protein